MMRVLGWAFLLTIGAAVMVAAIAAKAPNISSHHVPKVPTG